MGDRELRKELNQLLSKGDLTDPSLGHRRLRHLIDHARVGYLDRWAKAIQSPTPVKPERLARTLSAHLLDLGYTAPHLAKHWVTELRRACADTQAIVQSAADLAAQTERQFDVLLALTTIPGALLPNRPADGCQAQTSAAGCTTTASPPGASVPVAGFCTPSPPGMPTVQRTSHDKCSSG